MKKIFAMLTTIILSIISVVVYADTFKVERKYRTAYESTCAVVHSGTTDFNSSGGTGVMLNSGYILTCVHVVDMNMNGKVDREERSVNIKFYYPVASVHSGTVVASSTEHWIDNTEYALIFIPQRRASNVRLISDKDYKDVGVGAKLFSVGRTDGQSPPHIVLGVRSTDASDIWHRSTLPLYFGNSGGGIFLEETGELIGICSRIRVKRMPFGPPLPVPHWSEYLPIPNIRDLIRKDNKGFLIKNKVYF